MARKRGRMSEGSTVPTIPSAWYGLLPGMRLAFWVKVASLAKRRGVRKQDFAGVRKLAMEQHAIECGIVRRK